MKKIRTQHVECDRGNLSTKINEFLETSQTKPDGFELVDIKHAVTTGGFDNKYTFASALIIYKICI